MNCRNRRYFDKILNFQTNTQTKNEKFFFYPEFVGDLLLSSFQRVFEPVLLIELEAWDEINGLNWSVVNFSFNILDEVEELWIFKF